MLLFPSIPLDDPIALANVHTEDELVNTSLRRPSSIARVRAKPTGLNFSFEPRLFAPAVFVKGQCWRQHWQDEGEQWGGAVTVMQRNTPSKHWRSSV